MMKNTIKKDQLDMTVPYIISTDSGCDLSKKECMKRNIEALPMYFLDGDKTYLDTMRDEDLEKFYENIKAGTNYKTTSINQNEAYTYFTDLLKKNKNIIHICLGSKISGSFNNCMHAKAQIEEEDKEANIYILDSTLACLGYGILAIEASNMRDEGKSFEEVVKYLEDSKRSINTYYTTNTLTYLARGGRVSKIASIFGNALSIKPILRLNYEGALLVDSKGHGLNKTYAMIINKIKETVINPENQILYISHSNCLDVAKNFASLIMKEIPFKSVFYSFIGSIIGAHTGPGLVAAFYHGKERF